MARKIALTPAAIDNLHKGLLADLQTPGLAIEVLAADAFLKLYGQERAPGWLSRPS